MITGLEATSSFVLLVAPGFLLVRGYSRRRYHAPPERDLYALAQAVIASAIWLAFTWILLLALGDPLKHWGVVPLHTKTLQHHRADLAWLGLAVVMTAYLVGAAGAISVDLLNAARRGVLFRLAKRAGLLRSPSAWDRAWTRFWIRQPAGEVVVRLKDGHFVRGGYGYGAQVDLSPRSPQLFLTSGYGWSEANRGGYQTILANGPDGVFIQGSEIAAIYFQEKGDAGAERTERDNG